MFGPGCRSPTSTVRIDAALSSLLRLAEPTAASPGGSATVDVRIPLLRSSSQVEATSIQLDIAYQSSLDNATRCSATGGGSSDEPGVGRLCNNEAADYILLPPYDNVTWLTDERGVLTVRMRLFHDGTYEPREIVTLRVRLTKGLVPDCTLDGPLEVTVMIEDQPSGVCEFAQSSVEVSESESVATVVLYRQVRAIEREIERETQVEK